jgi:CBS domain-containing protein
MAKTIPPVQNFMSSAPYVIGADESLASAHALMRDKRIRHLPVLGAGLAPVGVVSDGDLYQAEAIQALDARTARVRDVVMSKPYTVFPGTPVDEVVEEMAGRKLDSALVVEGGRLVGIFTATDALGAFYALMQTRMK